MPENLRLIIINNKGGRIFDMLNLDKRIVLEHDNNFKKITEGMGLTYSSDITKFGEVQVLELFPDPKETQSFLEEWNT
jgi:2-succinyl-5-enolpyruvyl-6-hydroxy-3-cyclohexene-1-carboxylate synthase